MLKEIVAHSNNQTLAAFVGSFSAFVFMSVLSAFSSRASKRSELSQDLNLLEECMVAVIAYTTIEQENIAKYLSSDFSNPVSVDIITMTDPPLVLNVFRTLGVTKFTVELAKFSSSLSLIKGNVLVLNKTITFISGIAERAMLEGRESSFSDTLKKNKSNLRDNLSSHSGLLKGLSGDMSELCAQIRVVRKILLSSFLRRTILRARLGINQNYYDKMVKDEAIFPVNKTTDEKIFPKEAKSAASPSPGFLYVCVDSLVELCKFLNIVEWYKAVLQLIARRFGYNRVSISRFAVDSFMAFKWIFVSCLILYGYSNLVITCVVWYLIFTNLFTYFYYHVWCEEAYFTAHVDLIRSRRRVMLLLLSFFFSVWSFAFLYYLPYKDEFMWGQNYRVTSAFMLSVSASFAGGYEIAKPVTAVASSLVMVQLLVTFLYATFVVSGQSLVEKK